MRYSKDHKDETRAQILSAAARLFRTEGIASVSVADVMADVGLTHGGFYRYFPSKEALVKESVASAVAATSDYLASQKQVGVGGLEGLLRAYLRDARRDSPHNGCVFSILTAEMARRPADSKESFLEGLDVFVELIFEELPATVPKAERWRRATVIFGLMVGVMQIARLMGDEPASDAILDEGVRSALQLAAGGPETKPTSHRK